MIFKTFNSDIDKISSKWGIFGRSFNDISTAIVRRITDINKAFQATDDLIWSIKDSDSIWKRLYPNKESIKDQLIDVDSLIPEIDKNKFDFDSLINELNDIDKKVKAGTLSWQDYSNSLNDNQKWISKWGEETEGQICTQEGVIKANQQARATAIAHNEAIKAQTLSAKVGSAALKGLAIAGNMIAFAVITKTAELAAKAIDNYVHRVEKANDAMKSAVFEYDSAKSSLEDITSELVNQSKRMDELLSKDKLTYAEKGELEELQAITNELLIQQDIEEKRVARASKRPLKKLSRHIIRNMEI